MAQEFKDEIVQEYSRRRNQYVGLAGAAETLIRQLLDTAQIVPHDVEARAKELESLRAKIALHPQYESLGDLPDLCGLRVILYYPSEVEAVATLLANEFEIIEREVHGAEVLESFGYSSVHLVCRLSETRRSLREWSPYADLNLEVQIRTVLQHAWAVISHRLTYKSNDEIPANTGRTLFRVAALLETGDELFDSFRAEVEAIRLEYGRKSAADEWRELPIDLDSVREAWTAMWSESLLEKIDSFGFNPDTTDTAQPEFSRELGRLVEVSNLLGISTLGSLADAAAEALEMGEHLKTMALVTPAEGKVYSWTRPAIIRLAIFLAHPEIIGANIFAEPVMVRVRELLFPEGATEPISDG